MRSIVPARPEGIVVSADETALHRRVQRPGPRARPPRGPASAGRWTAPRGAGQPAESRDEEVERILALGATVDGDHRRPDGRGRVTPADPEGNEFCVERGPAERGDTP
ncbi:VOC family protein [Streptomyces sp. NPDC013953]|uniref:VOC family protein n=1 Tax=Streptomyces sp. NPDC013953 TaxID=3364868 RepID=UPI0036FFE31B